MATSSGSRSKALYRVLLLLSMRAHTLLNVYLQQLFVLICSNFYLTCSNYITAIFSVTCIARKGGCFDSIFRRLSFDMLFTRYQALTSILPNQNGEKSVGRLAMVSYLPPLHLRFGVPSPKRSTEKNKIRFVRKIGPN